MVIPFESPGAVRDTLVPMPSDDPVERWLDRVTCRLGVDRELQIEVRQELRSHLDESAAELHKAGRTAAEARDEALRALGDEDELADALWKANRRRVRLRAVGAWAARLVFPAAAAMLVVFLAYGAFVIASMVHPRVFAFYVGTRDGRDNAADRYRAAVLADAPADVQLLFEQEAWRDDELAVAKRLAELVPEAPALYANYALTVGRQEFGAWVGPAYETDEHNRALPLPPPPPRVDEARLTEALKVFADGERREPGNAVYPALAASALFEVSSVSVEDEALAVQRPGREHPDTWSRQTVFDERRFGEALAAARRAADKPYYRTYAAELARRKSAALPAGRVADVWLRGTAEQSVLGWNGRPGGFVREAAVHATTLAARPGKREEAERLVRDLRLFAGKVAEGSETTEDVHVAHWLARTAGAAEARLLRAAGDVAGADRAWAQTDAARDRYQAAYAQMTRAEHRLDQAGLMYSGMLRDAWRYGDVDAGPMRRAEYAAADQLGVAIVAAAMLGAAGVYAIAAGVQWLRARRQRTGHAPPRLFVGHRRVAWVVGVGAVSPVVLYLGYAGIEPLSGRGDGLNATLGRVLVEYGLLTLTVLLLVIALSRRAVLDRMKELGVSPRVDAERMPAWRRAAGLVALAIGAVCLAAVLVLATGMLRDVSGHTTARAVPLLLAAGWVSIAGAAGFGLWRGRGRVAGEQAAPVLAGALARSAFPVVVTAALVVALAGLPLRQVEARNVRAVVGAGPLVSEKVVGESGYDAIREELVREYDLVLSREPGVTR